MLLPGLTSLNRHNTAAGGHLQSKRASDMPTWREVAGVDMDYLFPNAKNVSGLCMYSPMHVFVGCYAAVVLSGFSGSIVKISVALLIYYCPIIDY